MAESKIPTNEEIIEMIPSKAVREYLVKINWQFDEHERDILRRYIKPRNKKEADSVYAEQNYVTLPHPFRKSDIVTVCDKRFKNRKPEIGIMWSPKDDEEFWNFDRRAKTDLKGFVDFTDVATTVDFLSPEDGFFRHGHPNPLWIEYAELDEDSAEARFLRSAVKLQNGEGSLEETDELRSEYVASRKKKISKNLGRIK